MGGDRRPADFAKGLARTRGWMGRGRRVTRFSLMGLILRPFGPADEVPAKAAWSGFHPVGFEFLSFDFDPSVPWTRWTEVIEGYRRGVGLPEGRVRGAFLAADVEGQLVGSVSIRFELNDFLASRGGHIGYGVIPAFRRRGYATAM